MTDSYSWFDERFAATRAMVIMRGLGVDTSLEFAERAWDVGITMLELPVQSDTDLDAVRVVAAAAAARGLVVGAGTIVSVDQIAAVREAGASYTVSPGTDEDVIRASLDAGLPTLPGVATASEIQRCRRLGLSWLKAFPASFLGTQWIPAMHGPFPDVRFVVTGGMSSDNADAFLDAGARVVALSLSPSRPDQWEGLSRLSSSD